MGMGETRNEQLLRLLAERGVVGAEVFSTGGNCWALGWPIGRDLRLFATSDSDVATGPEDMPYWAINIEHEGEGSGSGVSVPLGLTKRASLATLAGALVRYVPLARRRMRQPDTHQGMVLVTTDELAALGGTDDEALACPNCSQVSWKLDEEVTVRAAIIVSTVREELVWVDRAGGDPAKIPDQLQGAISCHSCGFDLHDLDDPAIGDLAAEIYQAARRLVAAPDTDWKVLEDYRQF